MPVPTRPAAAPVVHRALAPLTAVEIRDAEGAGGSYTFEGYAAVTDVETTLYEGRAWVWRERIAPGAFAAVLEQVRARTATYDVVLNHEHDNRASMASTARPGSQLGGLELSEDGHGLRTFARLDPSDPDVMRVVPKIRNGVCSQMSFAFVPDEFETLVTEDDRGRTIETDTILSVRALYDVTVCAHGAYPQTSLDLRGLLASTGRSGFDPEGDPADRAPADPAAPHRTTTTAPGGPAGGGDPERDRRLRLLKARARVVIATHRIQEN